VLRLLLRKSARHVQNSYQTGMLPLQRQLRITKL
jgi:hypothetical protein